MFKSTHSLHPVTPSIHFFFFNRCLFSSQHRWKAGAYASCLGLRQGRALGRSGSSLGHVETNNHTQICTRIRLMCKCINISLMCMCLTTQTERGKLTRDLVVTSRTAAPSCRLLHHSLGANKCTEGEAECKKSLHFSPTKSFTDKRQRVHCTR